MRFLFLLPLAVASALAVPIQDRATGPSVVVKNGTIVGSTLLGVDSFKGIPFALPPIGSLRLKPPQSYNTAYPSGTLVATGTPTACPQFLLADNLSDVPEDAAALLVDTPFVQTATVSGEDCLTLNVQRPSGTTSSSNLPVVFWIFGGGSYFLVPDCGLPLINCQGFEFGSTQTYDATAFLTKADTLVHPFIFVAVNYRVTGFGFLAGKELQADGSTNLGLRDQRLGLEWVAENIAAFGGDPTRVTLWGESAGSISVFDHTIINGGDNTYNGKALFHGAIMDSGSVVPANDVTTSKAQVVYDSVVSAAGCSASSDTLACLRAAPYTTFLNAVNSVPNIFSYRALDLSYLPRPDPSNSFFSISPDQAVKDGQYVKVPIIIGDQEDEGTLFSLVQSNITNTAQLTTYLQSYFPQSASLIPGLVATYPDNAPDGSPFRTGLLNEIYPEFKRLAAILGDITFMLTRRSYLASVASTLPGQAAYSYIDSHLYGTPVLGTFHASDILEAYFDTPDAITAATFQTYYTSFINYLDPNQISTASPLISWPKWSTANPEVVNFNALSNNLLADTFRNASYEYLVANTAQLRI